MTMSTATTELKCPDSALENTAILR